MEQNLQELAALVSEENGKTIGEATAEIENVLNLLSLPVHYLN